MNKQRPQNLAIFGAAPAFAARLHVGRPNVGNSGRFLDRARDLLDRRWLTNDGPLVQEFEARVAQILGVKHCIAMCNGTVALEIAIRAAGLTGEVILPSFTFIATAHALQWQELTPVFCDIDPETHNIDATQIERLITPRTSGILAVHIWGRPCPIDELQDVADRYRLKLLFDAAHAFGCSRNSEMIGGFGLAEVFSFHATKFVNTFEGGAVATNDEVLAQRMRLMRNFGFAGVDNVVYLGTNGKMSEVCAAMGLTSLESMDEFIAFNRRNYRLYCDELHGIPGVRLLDYDESEACNYQYIVVVIDQNLTRISRDHLVEVLWSENVIARRYFYPGCHRMEPYRSYYPNAGLLLPRTEELAARVLLLPTGTAVGVDEIPKICDIIRNSVANAEVVTAHLRHLGSSVITPHTLDATLLVEER
jgi:dTDP-4-amino-4,6-dideoxygalactose transaminase